MYILTFIIRLLYIVPIAHADAIDKYCSALHWACGTAGVSQDFAARVANQVIYLIQSILAVVAVVAIIWGGTLLASSGASEENRNKGKNIIISTVIGVILAILATEAVGFAFTVFRAATT